MVSWQVDFSADDTTLAYRYKIFYEGQNIHDTDLNHGRDTDVVSEITHLGFSAEAVSGPRRA